MFDSLNDHFRKYIILTSGEEKIIQSLFRYRKYRKHQYILQDGDSCKYETFIVKGCTRTYEIDDKGQEHILQFALEGWWAGDLYSFLSATTTRMNIVCIEDTEVLNITKDNLEELYKRVPSTERYFRILMQNAYLSAISRIYSNLSKTAIARYQEFLQKYPDIEQRVPNHQIASFLGITPQSLSRVRSNNLKTKR